MAGFQPALQVLTMGRATCKGKTAFRCERRLFVLPAGLEPATYCSASKRSNPLSYGSIFYAAGILLYYHGRVKQELFSCTGFSRRSGLENYLMKKDRAMSAAKNVPARIPMRVRSFLTVL